MSGMKSDSTTARSISLLEVPHGGRGQHLAEEERAQPARRACGSSRRSRSRCTARRAPPCRPSAARARVCSATMASMTSSTVTMPRRRPRLVHHRQGEQVVLADQPGRLLTGSRSGATVIRRRFGATALMSASGSAMSSSRSDTTCFEPPVAGSIDVDRVDGLLRARDLSAGTRAPARRSSRRTPPRTRSS